MDESAATALDIPDPEAVAFDVMEDPSVGLVAVDLALLLDCWVGTAAD